MEDDRWLGLEVSDVRRELQYLKNLTKRPEDPSVHWASPRHFLLAQVKGESSCEQTKSRYTGQIDSTTLSGILS